MINLDMYVNMIVNIVDYYRVNGFMRKDFRDDKLVNIFINRYCSIDKHRRADERCIELNQMHNVVNHVVSFALQVHAIEYTTLATRRLNIDKAKKHKRAVETPELCFICSENMATVCAQPCNHACCKNCWALTVFYSITEIGTVCPFCRSPVAMFNPPIIKPRIPIPQILKRPIFRRTYVTPEQQYARDIILDPTFSANLQIGIDASLTT